MSEAIRIRGKTTLCPNCGRGPIVFLATADKTVYPADVYTLDGGETVAYPGHRHDCNAPRARDEEHWEK